MSTQIWSHESHYKSNLNEGSLALREIRERNSPPSFQRGIFQFSIVFPNLAPAYAEEFQFFRQVTGPAEPARVFGESRRPQEGRVYRLRFVSGELTTNSHGITHRRITCPSRLLIEYHGFPFVLHLPNILARISSGVVGDERERSNGKNKSCDEENHKCQVCVPIGL